MSGPDGTGRPGATIDLPEAMAGTWDALVIGAGPGGAFAAREAARAGLATLLVERSTFPRVKVCGGCLNHTAVAVLRRAGLGERLARLGGPAITTVLLRQGRRSAGSSAGSPGYAGKVSPAGQNRPGWLYRPLLPGTVDGRGHARQAAHLLCQRDG